MASSEARSRGLLPRWPCSLWAFLRLLFLFQRALPSQRRPIDYNVIALQIRGSFGAEKVVLRLQSSSAQPPPRLPPGFLLLLTSVTALSEAARILPHLPSRVQVPPK